MSEPVSRITVSRAPSPDLLEDARGALLQAQVLSVVDELSGPFDPIEARTRLEEGEVRLIISAPDPAHLEDLADAVMLRYGHELPGPEEVAPHASQPPFATQPVYSARALCGAVGEVIVESTAKALLHEALERENLNDEDGLAEHLRAEVPSFRRLSERLGVTPPAKASAALQAARALLAAVPEGSFLGEDVGGDAGQAVLALLKEKGLITQDEAITTALSLS